MRQRLLTAEEVLDGFDAIATLYPFIPSLSLWRAWEYAAFRHYSLHEPVLDLGCGDGRLFRLVWPHVRHVTGIDHDRQTVEIALNSGVYEAVHLSPADRLPVPDKSFASVFANSSIEHMDHLAGVLANSYSCLQPGGLFLLSVVTDKFIDWRLLPLLTRLISADAESRPAIDEYVEYHNLVNPLPVSTWALAISEAGFEVEEHVPMVPELCGRMFLFIDELWHVRHSNGELGELMHTFLSQYPQFPRGLRSILDGVMQMETDWTTGAGALFVARRPS